MCNWITPYETLLILKGNGEMYMAIWTEER